VIKCYLIHEMLDKNLLNKWGWFENLISNNSCVLKMIYDL